MSEPKVIAGFDGSAGSRRALHWAAGEAARTGRELIVTHAYDFAGAQFQMTGDFADDLRRIAEGIVGSAVKDAAARAPGVAVRGEAVVGPAGPVLADSGGDDLVVVGNRGRGGFASLVLGSVGHHVATHARGTVVVVRGRPEADSGPVVVGVDHARGDAALGVGFDAARARGTSLIAVHAYQPVEIITAYGAFPAVENAAERRADELAALRDVVAVWAAKYPDVTVETTVTEGHPTEVLTGLSRTAQLVVVGHRTSGLGQVGLGPVAAQLLHHADCPVMIARTEPASGV